MTMPNYLCDLHLHTNRSDGADTPKELLDHAAELGMAVVAITDHDIRPPDRIAVGRGEMAIGDYARSKGLRLLCGMEISCETDIEDTHIVAFGCDWNLPYFEELEKSVVVSKVESYRKLVEELNRNGIQVTWEEVLDNAGTPVNEDAVQKKMLFELLARKGYAKSWSDAKKMLKNHPQYQINRKKPSAVSIICGVRGAGGISILAHPYLISEMVFYEGRKLTRDQFIRILIAAGLNGIEANYTYDKTSYGGDLTKEQISREVMEKYGPMVELLSGGSDYHADGKKGVAKAREIGEAGIDIEYFDAHLIDYNRTT